MLKEELSSAHCSRWGYNSEISSLNIPVYCLLLSRLFYYIYRYMYNTNKCSKMVSKYFNLKGHLCHSSIKTYKKKFSLLRNFRRHHKDSWYKIKYKLLLKCNYKATNALKSNLINDIKSERQNYHFSRLKLSNWKINWGKIILNKILRKLNFNPDRTENVNFIANKAHAPRTWSFSKYICKFRTNTKNVGIQSWKNDTKCDCEEANLIANQLLIINVLIKFWSIWMEILCFHPSGAPSLIPTQIL